MAPVVASFLRGDSENYNTEVGLLLSDSPVQSEANRRNLLTLTDTSISFSSVSLCFSSVLVSTSS